MASEKGTMLLLFSLTIGVGKRRRSVAVYLGINIFIDVMPRGVTRGQNERLIGWLMSERRVAHLFSWVRTEHLLLLPGSPGNKYTIGVDHFHGVLIALEEREIDSLNHWDQDWGSFVVAAALSFYHCQNLCKWFIGHESHTWDENGARVFKDNCSLRAFGTSTENKDHSCQTVFSKSGFLGLV